MPFMTPDYIGRKQAISFLKENLALAEELFIKEGQEMSKQYREESSQQRYLQGWIKAWPEVNVDPVTQSVLNEINKGLESYEGDPEPFDRYLEEKREYLRKDGWYLYYDPNAKDMEGEYKVAPLARLQEAK